MDCHVDIVFITYRHYRLQEIYEIFKKLLFIDILVLFKEISYFTESFRFPSGHHGSVHLILNGIKHIGGIDSINGVL